MGTIQIVSEYFKTLDELRELNSRKAVSQLLHDVRVLLFCIDDKIGHALIEGLKETIAECETGNAKQAEHPSDNSPKYEQGRLFND